MARRKQKLPAIWVKWEGAAPAVALEATDGFAKYVQRTGAQLDKSGSNPNIRTPVEFVRAVRRAYGDLTVDLAAEDGSQIEGCRLWITPQDDSIQQPWAQVVNALGAPGHGWCNPPYNTIRPWVEKASKEAHGLADGHSFKLLVPASVGAKYWREFVDGKCFEQQVGRIAFEGYEAGSMKDHCLLHYGNPRMLSAWHGVGAQALERYWDWKALLTQEELAAYSARAKAKGGKK